MEYCETALFINTLFKYYRCIEIYHGSFEKKSIIIFKISKTQNTLLPKKIPFESGYDVVFFSYDTSIMLLYVIKSVILNIVLYIYRID